MKKNAWISACLSAGLFFAVVNNSVAGDEKGGSMMMSPTIIEQVDIINKLIDLGDARKDPLILLAAAKLQKGLEDKHISTSDKARDNASLLHRAKKLAHGRKDLNGIADDIAASKSKGQCYGPGTYYGCF